MVRHFMVQDLAQLAAIDCLAAGAASINFGLFRR